MLSLTIHLSTIPLSSSFGRLQLPEHLQMGLNNNATIDSIEYTITEESVRRQLQLADASGITMLQNEEIFEGLQNIGPLLPAMLTIDAGQPQPSAAPIPSQPVPTPSPSHVQITPPPISQPPPTLTQPVQSTSPPPQPSSLQPASSPPITTIPDTQPTLPPSPQIPSPSYHDTEGPSFEPSYHMSPPPSHEPEIQTSRPSEESEQLRNLLDLVPRLESRVESLEKELSDTKQTLGTAILQLIEKVKKLEYKLRQKRKREETVDEEDAEGQDQDVPSPTDQGNKFATPEKSKDSGEAQAEQIRFKGTQALIHGSKIYRRKPKSTTTPTKILDFEEPAERLVNTGSTPTAQVNTGSTPTAQVNNVQVNTGSTPTAQVNTAEVNTAELNTGETERVQRRKGKDPMTEEDLQAEVQASKKSKELQELAGLEAAQRLQATMDAETQRQIDLDALLARRLVEQEEEAAKEALATEFDYIQARLNADQILAEKIQQEEREQYSIEDRAKFLHDTIAAQRKFLAEQRYAAIRNKPPTISQLRNQMITYLKHVANKKHAELKSKSFEEIQVLYERYKKQDQTFVAIGSEEDERAIKKMNEQAADKEKEQKAESVHEEVKEEEGAKKRKLGTRRKLKAKRRKYTSGLTREDDDLKMCLHIAPDEDKVIDVEILDHQYPIVEWKSFYFTTKPQYDPTKPLEDAYLNMVTRSNGNKRFFRTLMGVLSIFDREDLKAVYELVMEKYQDEIPEGFDKMLWGDLIIMFNQGDTADFWDEQLNWKIISWKLHSSSGVHTIMTSNGLVIHMLVENRYPLTKEVLSQLLDLKLETEEESTMALELIKFVKQQLEEFEDSDDDDLAKSDHEEAERGYKSFKAHSDPVNKDLHVPQPSGLTDIVADEAVHKELGDSLVRAATTASSLEAEHDSGGGPRYQETMGDTIAQTRFENVSKHSNDSLLARVLDLDKTKTTQANEIDCLKRRVKKLERKDRSRTHGLKRLHKVGMSRRVESSRDEDSLGENASKQGRRINAIDADEDITLVNVQDDVKMFDVNTFIGDEVFAEL
ncbi:hypothetical protein Tco_0757329 [Tanacetum coccineum]